MNWSQPSSVEDCIQLLSDQISMSFDRNSPEPFDYLLSSVNRLNAGSFLSVMIEVFDQIDPENGTSRKISAYCAMLISKCNYLENNDIRRLKRYAVNQNLSGTSSTFLKQLLLDLLTTLDIDLTPSEFDTFLDVADTKPLVWLTGVLRYGTFENFIKSIGELKKEEGFLQPALRFVDTWRDYLTDAEIIRLDEELSNHLTAVNLSSNTNDKGDDDDYFDTEDSDNLAKRFKPTEIRFNGAELE